MSGEWKPGDVAMVRHPYENYVTLGIRTTPNGWRTAEHGYTSDPEPVSGPLLVIDPEDREQVERLQQAVMSGPCFINGPVRDWQAALRSMLAPPRPEEPTGLGAVVEDADGERWVRMGGVGAMWIAPSLSPRGGMPVTRDHYDQIPAVHVLSEGVTA